MSAKFTSGVFAALLDVAAQGLSRLPRVHLSRLPRMADFALWGIACETAYAAPGAFLTAYEAHAAEAIDVVIENDPVATAITAFMHGRVAWSGTVTELLRELSTHDRAEAQPSGWKSWPKDPAVFGKAIQRVKGALRKTGIAIIKGDRTPDRTRTRLLELRRIEVPPARATDTDNVATDGADGTDSSEAIAKIIALRGS
jgi:hypothetical protein